ncbi:MAG: chlorite dismutase family protein [Thaumarchaeota archaeon]|nr:chlorite dismutase family protein [Nitrososphaerota archaeon]
MSEQERTFFNFSFFKVDPKWRWMADLAKEESAKEVENVLRNSQIRYRSYSTLGLRDDAEFLIWYAAESVERFQEVAAKLYATVFGKYVMATRVYLSSTRPSVYSKSQTTHGWLAGQEQKKYVVVYPFIKTREWYLLPIEKRKEMMAEHIAVGQRYQDVYLNTTYSFGIHDEDFMLAFETDTLERFQDLIMDLRETQVSRYVQVDTPMIVCVGKEIFPLIRSLG